MSSCIKEEGEKDLLTEDTGIKQPSFSDGMGYLTAFTYALPSTTNTQEFNVEYSISSLISAAYFLPSAGSDKYDPDGAGTVILNGNSMSNLYGSYVGSSLESTKAVWEVTGNTKVAAFKDSCMSFVPLTGLTIPNWSSCPVDEDLVITLNGNTNEAYSIFIECESKPAITYGDDKFLTKEIQPGQNSCTISASELQALKDYYYFGFTLIVEAYTYKKTTSGGKSYYLINSKRLTHAVYFSQN